MPLPLLLIGAAVVAGGIGVAAGASAVNDFSKAKDIAAAAKKRLEDAEKRMRQAGDATNARLAQLGRIKLEAGNDLLRRVVAVADRVHVGKDQMQAAQVRGVSLTSATIGEMKRAAITAGNILGTGAAALSTGALAGFGALGLASAVGTASTGTAISALSGAAASNATLAWLGGGALSAGGFGVAGGTAAVAGIVAGPALAIAGIALAIKADQHLTDATAYAASVDVAVETIGTALVKVRAIDTRVERVDKAIGAMGRRLLPVLQGTEAVLDTRPPGRVPFASLDCHEQALYKTTLALGAALYQLIEVDIVDELGEVTAASAEALNAADRAAAAAPDGAHRTTQTGMGGLV